MVGFSLDYVAGDWVAIAGPNCWLVAELGVGGPEVRELWARLRDGIRAGDVLAIAAGRALAGAHSFGLAVADGEAVTLILRGKAEAFVTSGESVVNFDSRHSLTWAEHRLQGGFESLRIGNPDTREGPRLPLALGVAQASVVVATTNKTASSEVPVPPEEIEASPPTGGGSVDPPTIHEVAEGELAAADEVEIIPAEDAATPRLESATVSLELTPVPEGPDADDAAADVADPDAAALGVVAETREYSRDADGFAVTDGLDPSEAVGFGPTGNGGSAEAGLPPEAEEPEGYAYLFGMTVDRSVEDAAIRTELERASEHQPTHVAGGSSLNAASELAESPTLDKPAGHSAPVEEPLATSSGVGLIDSVPWDSTPGLAARPAYTPPERQVANADPIPSDDSEGVTISREALRSQLHSLDLETGIPGAPSVMAVRCSSGHANPAHAVTCRICHSEIPIQAPATMPRPVLGSLVMSTGDVISLDRGVLFGRSPDPERLVDGQRPHVVKVASPNKDVSRNHVEVRLDGWRVLVVDLDSTNGTMVTMPGRTAERLRPESAYPIEPGAVVSIADEFTFRFEVSH